MVQAIASQSEKFTVDQLLWTHMDNRQNQKALTYLCPILILARRQLMSTVICEFCGLLSQYAYANVVSGRFGFRLKVETISAYNERVDSVASRGAGYTSDAFINNAAAFVHFTQQSLNAWFTRHRLSERCRVVQTRRDRENRGYRKSRIQVRTTTHVQTYYTELTYKQVIKERILTKGRIACGAVIET